MNIAVLTADLPQYLPAFFSQFLEARAPDTKAIFLVPTRHGKESTRDVVRKYIRAFGVWNFLRLGFSIGKSKLLDRLTRPAAGGPFYSIAAACRHHNVECKAVLDVNDKAFHDVLREKKIDMLVSVSCPQIFRKALIDLPALGTLNVHGAKLPKYRGLLPSFWMMVNDEKEAGVTVFLVNTDIDAGDVVETSVFPIEPGESLDKFIIRSKRIACDTLLRAIDKIEGGDYRTTPLTAKDGSYFSFPTRESYRAFRKRGRRMW